MNWKPAIVASVLLTGLSAAAQESNQVRQTNYGAFQLISQQNIFNQHRVARRRESGRPRPTTPVRLGDAFSLVGTMSYGKGQFAFFDGTHSDFRKVLTPEGEIAGYKVAAITTQGVKLDASGQQFEMPVGTQLRRDSDGTWRLVAAGELPAAAPSAGSASASETASSSSSSGSSGDVNDVLKRLMQKREQELK